MHSARTAADLLTAAATLEQLAPLARFIGDGGSPLPLSEDVARALGLQRHHAAQIVRGRGALRIILVEWPRGAPLRQCVTEIAARLTARVPQLLWLIIAAERGGTGLVLATWHADRPRPRIAALTVDRRHVVPSDAETVCALAAAQDADDVATHAHWVEVLGRDALTRRFYRVLEDVVSDLATHATVRATEDARRDLALLWVSRLLFLSFLETKGWLDGDRRFLARHFESAAGRRAGAHQHLLLPLCFGTLNTPLHRRAAAARSLGAIPFLNGGLFARSPLERRHRDLHFPDASLARYFDELLARFRFTAREDAEEWSDAAVDPEMLGRAFESLMAARDRRSSGAYYTPQVLVSRATRAALTEALAASPIERATAVAALEGRSVDTDVAAILRHRAADLRVCDPACGSGAFLVHALDEVARLLATLGDPRSPTMLRRDLLTRSIFGVDLNPTAVWLCELRLWLAVIIEHHEPDPLRVPPLPNLDRHIRVGDALSGDAFDGSPLASGGAGIARLRARYARASGSRKRTLERELDRAERAHARAMLTLALNRCQARRHALLTVWRGRDLFGARYTPAAAEREDMQSLRGRARGLRASLREIAHGGALPFSFATHFPDAAARGGFDVLLGNPPWVRLHRIPPAMRARLRARYSVFAHAGWAQGANAVRAGRGFAAQVDLAALFVERSCALVRDGAPFALLLPAKLWHSLAGGGVRRLLSTQATMLRLEDWSEQARVFDAVAYPSLLVARRGNSRADVTIVLPRRHTEITWTQPAPSLGVDPDASSPWLLLPPPVRAVFDRLRTLGVPLHESALGRPLLGVKCGCNDAFVATRAARDVEPALLRPVVRGELLRAWSIGATDETILWTHAEDGRPLTVLPPRARRWMERWRPRLSARSDVRGSCWWSLFRIHAAAPRGPRVVWADIGRVPRAAILPRGNPAVPLNSCYVVPCTHDEDAFALATLLNSPVASAWLNALAEPARGGYRRYLAWTVAMLPIPRDWSRARELLAPLGVRATAGEVIAAPEIIQTTARAYRARAAELEPLLAWMHRHGS